MTIWNAIATISVRAYMNGEWVDLTSRVLQPPSGGEIYASEGRATELAQIDPSAMTLTLKNRDGAVTPGNPSSPYYPYWQSGIQLEVTESIGARTFRLPDMWLEIPEVDVSYDAVDDADLNDRVLRVSAVDRLAKLNRAPRFVSVLGEYIRYHGLDLGLVALWSLGDPSGSTSAQGTQVDAAIPPMPLRPTMIESGLPNALPGLLVFGQSVSIPGDDLPTLLSVPAADGTYGSLYFNDSSDPINGCYAMSLWVRPTAAAVGPVSVFVVETAFATMTISVDASGFWAASRSNDQFDGSVTSTATPTINQWQLVTVTVDDSVEEPFPTTGALRLFVNDLEASDLTEAGTPVIATRTRIQITGVPSGYLAYAQVYDTPVTFEDHYAQYQAGLNGLVYQSVDERIRTIANYAGVTDSYLELQGSDTLMQAPAFAGQRPGALITSAATDTGGGIVFTRGHELVYQDRKHRFNL